MKKIVTPFLFFLITAFGYSQTNYVPNVTVSTFAGNCSYADGQGASARFNGLTGIAVDVSGNLYVADAVNNEIRKITPGGLVSTLAGSTVPGNKDGQGAAASFNHPVGVAVDASGNVYVADTYNSKIRKITPGGLVTTLAGGNSGHADGQGTAASFNEPTGLAVDASGNVYVADTYNNEIRKITPSGLVSTLAGAGPVYYGSTNGQGSAATFYQPSAIAVDGSGNLYVADANNNEIRFITPAGLVSTFAGSTTLGSSDGQGAAAGFDQPQGFAVDASGNVYVADTWNFKIRVITSAGLVSTLAGSTIKGYSDGQGTAASFNQPSGITVDASGNLYIADAGNNEVRKITPGGLVSTFAGIFQAANGQGTAANFYHPRGITVDASGNVYVADRDNNEIRLITPAGLVSTFAGSITSGNVNGQVTVASFNAPSGLAIDAYGNMYIGDMFNQGIRKITSAGVVSDFAGQAVAGHTDGQGSAAGFWTPIGVAVDASGNIYIADTGNNEIRKITPGGLVSTLAGRTNAGNFDGQGSASGFNTPDGVAVDASGNVYVADSGNNEIRKITPGGLVSTFAGSSTAGHNDGQGTSASFSSPTGVAFDASGNLYVADYGNNMIRIITPGGLVSTLAGSITGGQVDGQGSLASFQGPTSIFVDASNNIYIADYGNNAIRKIGVSNTTTSIVKNIQNSSITVFPNPAKDILNIALSEEMNGTLSLYDIQGSMVLTQSVDGKQSQLSTASLQNGIYVLTVVSENSSYVSRVVIAR